MLNKKKGYFFYHPGLSHFLAIWKLVSGHFPRTCPDDISFPQPSNMTLKLGHVRTTWLFPAKQNWAYIFFLYT